jgi:CO dehydrogenase/acetyl-CoA synthase delta subunit
MPTLEEVLRAKEVELQTLQREVDALRLAMRLMATASASANTAPKPKKRLSQPEMAKNVLVEAAHEMHVRDISTKIAERFGETIKPSYLAPVLYRQIDRLFYKSDEKPNTFGLVEWKKAA